MIAINNQSLINYCRDCGCAGFTPALSYTYNAGNGNVVVTSATVISSPDSFSTIHVLVHDKFGGTASGEISTVSGNVTISASGLNATKGLNITATVITVGGCVADGGVYGITNAGVLGNWDKKFSEASAQVALDPDPDPDPLTADKSDLQATILEALGKVQADYTAPTWTTFANALNAALNVLGNGGATQSQIDNAETALSTAITGLVPD